MSRELYEICPLCDGDPEAGTSGSPCVACAGQRFTPIGLNVSQLEAMRQAHRATTIIADLLYAKGIAYGDTVSMVRAAMEAYQRQIDGGVAEFKAAVDRLQTLAAERDQAIAAVDRFAPDILITKPAGETDGGGG